MNILNPRLHDETSGLDYVLVGDYYIPAIELSEDDDRPIGKWGWMHKAYMEKNKSSPAQSSNFDGQATHLSCRPERTGTGALSAYHPADGNHRGRDGGFEAPIAMGMGQSHEQYCQPSRGNHQERDE